MGWAKPEEIAAKKEEDIGWSPPSKLLALLTVALFGQLLLGSSQETAQADAALLDLRAAYPPSGVLVRNLSLIPPDPRLPEEANRQLQALLASRHWIWRTMALEASSAFESWAEVRRANITSLGDILLVVMISTEPVALTESPVLSRRADLAWREMQRGLVHESARGKLVAAQNSSHFIQLDQSELVVETIRQAAAIEHVQTGNNLKCLYDNHRC